MGKIVAIGGGRYDNLIGRFTGDTVPAVGFSIGFERIFSPVMTTLMATSIWSRHSEITAAKRTGFF